MRIRWRSAGTGLARAMGVLVLVVGGAVVAGPPPSATAGPLGSAGAVVGWGDDSAGQSTPPAGLSEVSAVSGGMVHSLALRTDGTVVAWGINLYGEGSVPSGLAGVVAIAAGGRHNLALRSDHTVVAWGWDGYGQTDVPAGLTGVTAIAAGEYHSLALKADGTVVAWGDNGYGQSTVPAGLTGVVAIGGGVRHSVALKSDGTVVAWGYNDRGQVDVPSGLAGVVAIAAGDLHSLAQKGDGTVVSWGDNSYGQGTVPVGLSGVVAVAAGGHHSLALKADGTVVGWGDDTKDQSTPPLGLSGVVAIAAGFEHSLAIGFVPGDTTPPVFGECPVAGPFQVGSGTHQVGPISVQDQESAITASTLSGDVTTAQVGEQSIVFSATSAGGTSTKACAYQVVAAPDMVGPTLTHPAEVVVPATSADGAVVTFAASAVDDVDGAVPGTCTPASGSRFPVGATTVRCTASDAAGNLSDGQFLVTVTPAAPADADGDGIPDAIDRCPAVAGPASNGGCPVSPPPPPDTRPVPVVKLTAYAKFGKLRVDVDPNLPKAKYWRFTIQRLGRDGVTWSKWRTLRTTTKREVRSVNPPKGTYRVVVPEQRGYRAAVSVLVTLKR